jgi:hypothetical protein
MLRLSYFYNWQLLERNEFIRGFCFAIRGNFSLQRAIKYKDPTDGKAEPTDKFQPSALLATQCKGPPYLA